jgi:predicted O-methyltransferase YrrM
VGRGSYGGWDDADAGLARALWCLVRHARPERVVETGVARGLSTRVVLEGLERNRSGQLYSIDLPPLTVPERRVEIGAAVPVSRRDRWHYIEGSSRRRLRPLLRELGTVDLFIHDSWHSTRNTLWELDRAWASLSDGGAVVADDIDFNPRVRDLRRAREDGPAPALPGRRRAAPLRDRVPSLIRDRGAAMTG